MKNYPYFFVIVLLAVLVILQIPKEEATVSKSQSENQSAETETIVAQRMEINQEAKEPKEEQREKRVWTTEEKEEAKKAVKERKALRKKQKEGQEKLNWIPIYPGVIESVAEMGPNMPGEIFENGKPPGGMVKEMSIGPTNAIPTLSSDRMVVATETGGAWISEDLGENWYPIDDDWAWSRLSTVSQNPYNLNEYILGGPDSGLFRWDASNWDPNGTSNNSIEEIITHIPDDPWAHDHFDHVISVRHHQTIADRFFVLAAEPGDSYNVYVTLNGGDNFFKIFDGGGVVPHEIEVRGDQVFVATNAGIFSIERNPSGVWIDSFVCAAPSGTGLTEITVNQDNPNYVYCYFLSEEDNEYGRKDIHFSRTFNGTNIWQDPVSPIFNGVKTQPHDQALHVSNWPTGEHLVVFGQVEAFSDLVSATGYLDLEPVKRYLGHSDLQHILRKGSDLYVANDGGIFRYNIAQIQMGPEWPDPIPGEESLNLTFRSHQCNDVHSHPSEDKTFLTGIMHNGRHYKKGNFSDRIGGADGFQCSFKPDDPSIMYTAGQQGMISRHSGDPIESTYLGNNLDDLNEGLETRIFTHQNTPDALYHLGLHDLFVLADASSVNYGEDEWISALNIYPKMIRSYASEPYSINTPVYFIEKNDPIIHRLNFDPFVEETLDNDFSQLEYPVFFDIVAMSIDTKDRNRILAVSLLNTYEIIIDGTTAQWKKLERPNSYITLREIAISPINSGHLLLGTEVGLYESKDMGENWKPVLSIPAVRIDDICVRPDGHVKIATHGRGIWMGEFSDACGLDGVITGLFTMGKSWKTVYLNSPFDNDYYNFTWTAQPVGAKHSWIIGYGQQLNYTFASFGSYKICLTISDPNDPSCSRRMCKTVTLSNQIHFLNERKDTEDLAEGLSKELKVDLFPNPAIDEINLQLDEVVNGRISIFNVSGQLMKEMNINSQRMKIDLSELASGNYILILESENKLLAQEKFTVSH